MLYWVMRHLFFLVQPRYSFSRILCRDFLLVRKTKRALSYSIIGAMWAKLAWKLKLWPWKAKRSKTSARGMNCIKCFQVQMTTVYANFGFFCCQGINKLWCVIPSLNKFDLFKMQGINVSIHSIGLLETNWSTSLN